MTTADIRTTRRRRRIITLIASAVAALGVAGAIAVGMGASSDQARERVVAARGADVMPFDLDATTHRFTAAADGGVQTVVADDPADSRQVDLIQQHLQEEAAAFTRGEFDDPARIHGAAMPGLAALETGADRIEISYRSRDDGAEVAFRTTDPALVTALHDWFDAQTADHGGHAG